MRGESRSFGVSRRGSSWPSRRALVRDSATLPCHRGGGSRSNRYLFSPGGSASSFHYWADAHQGHPSSAL